MTAAMPGYSTEESQENNVYIARQPIFDLDLKVYSYELLFRDGHTNEATIKDGNHATSALINTLLELGLENITNHKLAFINLTRDYLIGGLPIPLPTQNIVLEVLEDVTADPEVIFGLKELRAKGYCIALDDFIITDANRDLLSFASIVKVDILPMSEKEIRDQVAILKTYPIKLLAEKVETEEQFQFCKELGFDYYQGYFFSKPKIISGKQIPANHLTILEIISILESPDCELAQIEKVISYDVGISYKLLKIINSSYYGFGHKINSIQHALVILGMDTLRSWITVISLSMIEDKPSEIILSTLIRAKSCEILSEKFKVNSSAAFTMGLFSLLDALMDQPLNEILKNLPLAEDIVEALLEKSGPLGELLQIVVSYETGDWQNIGDEAMHTASLNEAYISALEWAQDVTGKLS